MLSFSENAFHLLSYKACKQDWKRKSGRHYLIFSRIIDKKNTKKISIISSLFFPPGLLTHPLALTLSLSFFTPLLTSLHLFLFPLRLSPPSLTLFVFLLYSFSFLHCHHTFLFMSRIPPDSSLLYSLLSPLSLPLSSPPGSPSYSPPPRVKRSVMPSLCYLVWWCSSCCSSPSYLLLPSQSRSWPSSCSSSTSST